MIGTNPWNSEYRFYAHIEKPVLFDPFCDNKDNTYPV